MSKLLSVFAGATMLVGCGSQHINDYANTAPTLTLDEYFDGPVIAWGMVQDYNKKLTRRFCVEIEGSWEGNKGLLEETFYFDDGEVSFRNWRLTKNGNEYSGTAEDVFGVASGKTEGSVFQWQYSLQVKIDDSEYEFFLDDWIYKIDDYRVFNRTSMRKFGIEVAEITLFFDKEQPLRSCKKS
ncbi:DUF3833 domain-containing protein [Thalassotalea euphylliae]|uniref:DUF3833 domain-containing protein n=1 Tax=Thalassotalea euphylliae TaxID=1655234 RepID=UPI00363A17F5